LFARNSSDYPSHQLLTGVRLGDAGEVGRIAAAVIDGIKIPRIEDLQAEAAVGPPAPEVSWQADRHGRRCGTKLDQPIADFRLC